MLATKHLQTVAVFFSLFGMATATNAQDLHTEASLLYLELEGISRGYTTHSLDTYSDVTNALENDPSNGFALLYANLTRNSKWRGPYVQHTDDRHPQYGRFDLFVSDNSSLWFPDAPDTETRTDIFVRLTEVPCHIARATFTHLQELNPDALLLRYSQCDSGNTTISYHLGPYLYAAR